MENMKRDLMAASIEKFNRMNHENEKFKMEIQILRQHLKEEIDKVQ